MRFVSMAGDENAFGDQDLFSYIFAVGRINWRLEVVILKHSRMSRGVSLYTCKGQRSLTDLFLNFVCNGLNEFYRSDVDGRKMALQSVAERKRSNGKIEEVFGDHSEGH